MKEGALYRPLPAGRVLSRLAGEERFVLLETRRFDPENRFSYLFTDPLCAIEIGDPGEIADFFPRARRHLSRGRWLAGFFTYEAGCALEEKTAGLLAGRLPSCPLVYFLVFPPPIVFDHFAGTFSRPLPVPGPTSAIPAARPGRARLDTARADYCQAVREIKRLIAEGDTYQVNYTARQKFSFRGGSPGLYRDLALRQSVSYGAFLRAGAFEVLSFSPELFFRLEPGGRRLVTRPMKGTARRGLDPADDRRAALELERSPKDRSENLMIVDLLRNDLGRIARPGTVKVEKLFAVERYETLFQMTSTISAVPRPGTTLEAVFRALFPCGSVTGAPKIRTMEIIRELETVPRGVYTGALGFLAPDGRAVFNVAIRTLFLARGRGEMGVGGGIVWDSSPAAEYRECLLKARFLTSGPAPRFRLLETLAWKPPRGWAFLEEHLARLAASAEYFGFAFPGPAIRRRLARLAGTLDPSRAWRVRLLVSRDGRLEVAAAPLEPPPPGLRPRAALAPEAVSSRDPFLYHKTTRRPLYDRYRKKALSRGLFDYIFVNERGELTEGAISNLFLRRGRFLETPPLACGLLPGILRARLLASGRAREALLRPADLAGADAVYLGNSVRGLVEIVADMVK